MSSSCLKPRLLRRTPAWRGAGAILWIALAVVSCSVSTASPRDQQQIELTRNRQRWVGAGIRDYEFDYRLLCFCSPDATEPVHITVRQGVVATVVRQSDGLPVGTKYGGWPRVDDLFADVQTRLDQHVERIEVDYDPTLGYPRSIVVDVALRTADDEYSHTAGNLRPLP